MLLTGYYAGLGDLPKGVCGVGGLQRERQMSVEASRAFGGSADCIVQVGRTVSAKVNTGLAVRGISKDEGSF